jgi:hypothetical protein
VKRFAFFILLAVLAFSVIGCNPSQQALWEKDKATGYGGLYRHIVVTNGITNEVIYDKSGRCFIDDVSTINFIKILWLDENKKDNVYLGDNYSVIAEEISR